jgi:hypothetical protein
MTLWLNSRCWWSFTRSGGGRMYWEPFRWSVPSGIGPIPRYPPEADHPLLTGPDPYRSWLRPSGAIRQGFGTPGRWTTS